MRILHLVEAHTVHTARLAAAQLAAGHDVTVLTFHDFVGNSNVRVVPVSPSLRSLPYHHHWAGWSAVARTVRRLRPDIVHGHYLSTAALYLAAARAPRVVGTAVGSDILLDTRAAHVRLLLRALPRWVHAFTSVAPHVTRRMIELGLPAERIVTFPWGTDTEVFRPPSRMPTAPVVISTRNFEPVYDIGILLEAFSRISRERPDARLVLCGDGSLRPHLLRQAGELGIVRQVEFAGRLTPPSLAGLLQRASVYVTTAVSDGASSSLFEAMATGLVPVATDIEANRAWVHDGRNGLLFPPRDAIGLSVALTRALADADLRSRCYKESPNEMSERASFGSAIAALERIYRREDA